MDQALDEQVQVDQQALTYRPPLKSPHQAYCAAKSQCMTYHNDLRVSKKTPFSIAQVIPGTVIGPSEFVITRQDAIMHLDRQTKAILFDDTKPRYAFGFVHVQDCARIHIEALDEEKVKTGDIPPWYIAAATTKTGMTGQQLWKSAMNMMIEEFVEELSIFDFRGTFRLGATKVPINMPFRVDSRMTEGMLLGGDRIRGLEECVREVAQWYLSLEE